MTIEQMNIEQASHRDWARHHSRLGDTQNALLRTIAALLCEIAIDLKRLLEEKESRDEAHGTS